MKTKHFYRNCTVAFLILTSWVTFSIAYFYAKSEVLVFSDVACALLGTVIFTSFAMWSVYDLEKYAKYMNELDLDVKTLKHIHALNCQIADTRTNEFDRAEAKAIIDTLMEYRLIVQSNNPNRLWVERTAKKGTV